MDGTLVQVWQGLGAALGLLIVLLAVAWAGQRTLRQIAVWRRAWRGPLNEWRGAVDEPEDALIVWLAQKTGLSPEACAAFLSAFLQALAEGLGPVQGPASSEELPVSRDAGTEA